MNLYDILDKCNIDKKLIKVTLNKKRPGYPFDPELELIKYKEGKIDNTTHGRHIAWCGARRGSKFKKNDIIIQLIKQEDSEDIYKCGTVSKVISVTKNSNFIKDSNDPLLSNKWIVDIIPESDIVSIALEGKYFKNKSSKKSNFDYQFKYGDPYIDNFELIDNIIELDGKPVDQERLNDVMNRLGIADKKHNLPNQLSGGQQQRVAIARAIINNPALLLADEPTGNLDSKATEDIVSILKMTNQTYHQTILMITHNLEIAKEADRIIKISDGKIVGEE